MFPIQSVDTSSYGAVRSETTHTFHMSLGERTITLQYVVHLSLSIDELYVARVMWCGWSALVEQFLGVALPHDTINKGALKISC